MCNSSTDEIPFNWFRDRRVNGFSTDRPSCAVWCTDNDSGIDFDPEGELMGLSKRPHAIDA